MHETGRVLGEEEITDAKTEQYRQDRRHRAPQRFEDEHGGKNAVPELTRREGIDILQTQIDAMRFKIRVDIRNDGQQCEQPIHRGRPIARRGLGRGEKNERERQQHAKMDGALLARLDRSPAGGVELKRCDRDRNGSDEPTDGPF